MPHSEWSPEALSFAETTLYDAARLCVHAATLDNKRHSIAWMEDLLFKAVSDELEDQKISRKVGADMLGMSVRNFHRRRSKQKNENASLWESILFEFRQVPHSEAEIALKFPATDIGLLRAVIVDMKKSGVIEELDMLFFAKRDKVMDDIALESYVVALRMRGKPLHFPSLSKMTGRSEEDLIACERRIKADAQRRRKTKEGSELLLSLNNLLMQTSHFCKRVLAGGKPDSWRASLYVQPIREDDEELFDDLCAQLSKLEENAIQILNDVKQDQRDGALPCLRWSLVQTFGDLLPYRERLKSDE